VGGAAAGATSMNRAARINKGGSIVKYMVAFVLLLLAYTLFYAGLSKMSTGLTVAENLHAMTTPAADSPQPEGSRWDSGNWTSGPVSFFNALGLNKWNIKIPTLQAQIPDAIAQANQTPDTSGNNGTGSGANPAPSPTPNPTPTGTGPAAIYSALKNAGFSTAQAIGVMANMFRESSFDSQSAHMDTNGHMSYGLAQWNTASYPNAASLVTGNPAKDIVRQIQYLVQTGGLRAASGTSASQVASNFAADYERCVGCEHGGSANTLRQNTVTYIESLLGIKNG